jgi:DNA-binding NarL/FixJ family response regulator
MTIQAPHLIHILVIDEIPLISVGLQEVFRSIHPSIRVEYTDSVFRALSSREYENKSIHLVILGSDEEKSSDNLLIHATGLKKRFAESRIMVYTDQYDPELIAKTAEGTIDACIHKHEPAEEIRKAYDRLLAGETYISSIFDTLYYSYRFHG